MGWRGFLATLSRFLGLGTVVPALPWQETGRGTLQRWGQLCGMDVGTGWPR